MSQINLKTARKLCTAAEFHVVLASNAPQVNQHSAADLKKHTVEARRLRDKWRDQAQRQRRSAQQSKGARVTDDSARSAEKEALFADVLARFEAAKPSAATASATARPTKAQRSVGHRQARAFVRKSLSDHAQALKQKSNKKPPAAAAPAKKSPVKKSPVKKSSARKSSEQGPETAKTVSATTTKKNPATPPGPPAPGRKATRGPSPAAAGPLGSPPRIGNQLEAKTAAKKSRIERSGITSRIRGHISARGRRAQGRRDARG